MKIKILACTLTLIFLNSCSSSQEKIKNTFNEPVPISEIQERLPLSVEESIAKIGSVLDKHSLKVKDGYSDELKFSTNSIKITDQMCEGQYLKKAPLPCEVKFHGILIPERENVTVLRLLYQESCLGHTHIETRCKDSNAEKLLFSILKQIKQN